MAAVAVLQPVAAAASAAVAVPSPSPEPTPVVGSAGAEAAPASAAGVPPEESLDAVQLDAAKLQCYHVALELHTLSATLVSSLNRVVRDQLERASLSVVLNIAEAAGRHSRRDKRRFYTYARGSATEVAALLDVLERRHLAPAGALRTGRRLTIRIVQMLTRMDQRLLS